MTITGLEIFRIKVNRRGDWVIPRLQTSAGVTGIGDASQSGNDQRMIQFMSQLFDAMKGRSIYDIEHLRSLGMPQALARRVAGRGRHERPGAVSLGCPREDLRRAGLRTFRWADSTAHSPLRQYQSLHRSADASRICRNGGTGGGGGVRCRETGAVRRDARDLSDSHVIEDFTRRGIECAQAVRQTIGPKRDLLIDVHSHLDVPRGQDLVRRMEPLNLFWIEEVTPAKPVENLAAVRRAAKMKTAGGESILGVKGFYPYIRGQAVDIVMPDPKYCGGLLELKKIAAMAEGAGLLVSPHGPASPVGTRRPRKYAQHCRIS